MPRWCHGSWVVLSYCRGFIGFSGLGFIVSVDLWSLGLIPEVCWAAVNADEVRRNSFVHDFGASSQRGLLLKRCYVSCSPKCFPKGRRKHVSPLRNKLAGRGVGVALPLALPLAVQRCSATGPCGMRVCMQVPKSTNEGSRVLRLGA